MRQTATLYAMQIKEEIEQVQNQNSLEIAQKEREFNEKDRIYRNKIDQDIKEARETFLLQKSEIMKEREQLAIESQLFKAEEREKLTKASNEIDMNYQLAVDQSSIRNDTER